MPDVVYRRTVGDYCSTTPITHALFFRRIALPPPRYHPPPTSGGACWYGCTGTGRWTVCAVGWRASSTLDVFQTYVDQTPHYCFLPAGCTCSRHFRPGSDVVRSMTTAFVPLFLAALIVTTCLDPSTTDINGGTTWPDSIHLCTPAALLFNGAHLTYLPV